MSVKIYNVIGMGLIVGEKIKDMSKTGVDVGNGKPPRKIFLKYPAILYLNQQTRQGMKDIVVPPISKAFAGWKEMMARFELPKSYILYSGRPSAEIFELYTGYAKNLHKVITGQQIEVAGADALNQLPKDGRGEPIIQ